MDTEAVGGYYFECGMNSQSDCGKSKNLQIQHCNEIEVVIVKTRE